MTIRADKVRRGQQSFDAFAKETWSDWERLAQYLLRRWRVPAAVELDDVRSELLLAAWRAISKYDPARGGMTLDKFVVWCAISRAKRWIHRQRRAHNKSCREESRHDLS